MSRGPESFLQDRRDIPRVGVAVALAFVLGMVVFWQSPVGGQVSLEPLPILVLALWRGPRLGVLAGALEGTLHYIREPLQLHPLGFFLDYVLAGAALGAAGLMTTPGVRRVSWPWRAALGTTLGLGLKFGVHVASGYLLFSAGRHGWAAWAYSLGYNATYSVPQWGLHLALIPFLARRVLGQMARPSLQEEAL